MHCFFTSPCCSVYYTSWVSSSKTLLTAFLQDLQKERKFQTTEHSCCIWKIGEQGGGCEAVSFLPKSVKPRSDYVRYARIVGKDRKRKRKKRSECVQTSVALSVNYAKSAASADVNVGRPATFTTSTDTTVTARPMRTSVSVFIFWSRGFRSFQILRSKRRSAPSDTCRHCHIVSARSCCHRVVCPQLHHEQCGRYFYIIRWAADRRSAAEAASVRPATKNIQG